MAILSNNASKGDTPLDLSLATIKPSDTTKDTPLNLTLASKYETPRPVADLTGFNFQNIDRYKRFIDEIYPNVDLERQAATNQSAWGKWGNMFSQGLLGEVLAQGVVGGVGSLIGLPGAIIDEVRGKDADFSNFMTKFADDITAELQEKTPIFRYSQDKNFHWSDPGWWASNGVSIFSTLGMLIPALGEEKAASMFAKAIKKIIEVNKLNKVTGVGKALQVTSDIFDTERYWQKLTHSAFAMRNAENFRESAGVFNTVKTDAFKQFENDDVYQKTLNSEIGQEYLAEGRTPNKVDLANFIASKAAWKDYGMNAANVVFDAMQLAPLFKPFKVDTRIAGRLESNAVKNAQRKLLNMGEVTGINIGPIVKGAKIFVAEQLGEGAEELVNAISQSDSNWYGKHLINNKDDRKFGERLGEYLKDPASWEQAFWGFAGGVAFSGATRAIASIQDVINDTKDPHSDEQRINEIQNRYITITNAANNIAKVLKGINPETDEKFVGSDIEVKEAKENYISRIKTELGHNLGFTAAKHGNVGLLLDMISHPDFKEKMIELGATNENDFQNDLAALKQNIFDAETTYRDVYNKIFTDTASKPWLRNAIITQAISKKADIKHFTKLRDNARNKANGLRVNNPAFEALKEANQDKDFDGTLDNIINALVISYIDSEVESVENPTVKEVVTKKAQNIKDQFKLKDKELSDDKKASGNFNSINDLIQAEADARLYDIFLSVNNSLYEEILNTEKSIPATENKIKVATEAAYITQASTFRTKVNELSKVDNTDTNETIDTKIAELDKHIENIKKTNEDPFAEQDSPTKKLRKKDVDGYITALENRKKWLTTEKNRRNSQQEVVAQTEATNQSIVERLTSVLSRAGVDTKAISVKFTGKRNKSITNLVGKHMNEGLSGRPTDLFSLIDLINNSDKYTSSELEAIYTQLAPVIPHQFHLAVTKGYVEHLINEILIAAGYVTGMDFNASNISIHDKNAEDFKQSLEDENNSTKSIIDFTSQNPINKSSVDHANKWITGIVNADGIPLFTETNPDGSSKKTGTKFNFATIAARYGELEGIDKLRENFELLKLAYNIIRNTKVNPETGQKRIYNTEKTVKDITVDHIIKTFGLTDVIKDYEFSNNANITRTGGKDVTNIYLPGTELSTELTENGDQKASDDETNDLLTILTSLEEGTEITLRLNTMLGGKEGFSQNKNNQNSVPISVEAKSGNKSRIIGAINTIPTTHQGVKYNFKGKDWTDILLNDASTSNARTTALQNIFPLLQAWYNANKMHEGNDKINKAYKDLVDGDTYGILYELLGENMDLGSNEATAALLHISRVIFFGQNTNGTTPIAFNRTDVLMNIKQWKDKLYRDHINNTKIRQILGVDIDKILTSTVRYATTGSIIKSVNEDGTIKYRNLSVIDNPGKLKLFRIQKDSEGSVIENTRNKGETITGRKGYYTHSLFVGVVGKSVTPNGTNIIPVPVFNNTLDGQLISSENDQLLLNKVHNIILEIGKLRVERADATNQNNIALAETKGKEIDGLVDLLRDVVNIDYTDQGHYNALISNNHDIRFKPDPKVNRYVVYDFYNNKFYYERREGNNLITKDISSEEFKKELGNLGRNVNYNKLGKGIYFDILGNKHNSYEEYLINTNSIVTDVGQLLNKEGKKISNFMPISNNKTNSFNMIVNIDTSNIKLGINTSLSFNKFHSDFKLDQRYNFVFNIFDSLVKGGDIKFIVAPELNKIDKETGKPALIFYSPSNKTITVTKAWIDFYNKDQAGATLALVHDVLHALTGTKSKEEQKILLDNLNKFRDDLKNTQEYKDLLAKTNKSDIDNKIITILNMKDAEEILTYGLTDIDFAKFLDSIKTTTDKVTVSFWSKLKEIIREIARSLGVNTKLDELNYIFDQFINDTPIDQTKLNVKNDIGDTTDDILDADPDVDVTDKMVVFTSNNSVKEGYTRMYRAELPILPDEGTLPDWITTHEEYQKSKEASGRWFYKTKEEAEEFGRDFGPAVGGKEIKITYVDILTEDVEKYNAAIHPEASKFQGGPGITNEYFLPKEIANKREEVKAVSFTSTVNEELTGSPFTIEEEANILNVMANTFINIVAEKYKGLKAKDVSADAVRNDIIGNIAKKRRQAIEEGTWDISKDLLLRKALTTIRDNDKFWKHFRIHLSNQYGYTINDLEEYKEDIELLEKSWDQIDVFTQDVLGTLSEQVKNLINTTLEVDPNSVEINDNDNITWKTNNNTPTGFANTLSFSQRGNKLLDLMKGKQNKEEMLAELLHYANNVNSVFAKTLYSIHEKLSSDPELLNNWYTSFQKAIIDSYRDLVRDTSNETGNTHELTIEYGNKNAVHYHMANEWNNLIISRGENGIFNENFINNWNKLYTEVTTLSPGFNTMNGEVVNGIKDLYKMVGINIRVDSIMYEFREHQNEFHKNIIAPLLRIKGIPNRQYKENEKLPYIEQLQKNPNTVFNEFGNLLRLAERLKYFEEEHFTFSSTNIKGNLISNAGNPNFVTNFFNKLTNSDEVVYNALINYTKVASNQHSLLLWGDEIIDGTVVKQGRGILNYRTINGVKVVLEKENAINKENLARIRAFRYEGSKNISESKANEYSDLTSHDWSLKTLLYYFGVGETSKGKTVNQKLTAIFPLINPSDRKNTMLFEAPIIEFSMREAQILLHNKISNDDKINELKKHPMFNAIYNTVMSEIAAMNVAKQHIFELNADGTAKFNENGEFIVKEDIRNGDIDSQIQYHYKLDSEGNRHYITFKENGEIDPNLTGNVFLFHGIVITEQNNQITISDRQINGVNFAQQLLQSPTIEASLNTPLREENNKSTFNTLIEQVVLRFMIQQSNRVMNELGIYKEYVTKSYLKSENRNNEETVYILKDKDFNNGLMEYAFNTFLFNTEQVRLFYGSLADYKSAIDFNKRGGQVLSNGIPTTLTGTFYGSTISDVKIKSRIYDHMINSVAISLNIPIESISTKVRNKLNRIYTKEELKENKAFFGKTKQTIFTDSEREIYDIVSPYLKNDSANAVSLITVNEFIKRIEGFGLAKQYKDIINKLKNGEELDRDEISKFASMQKNFYYDLQYSSVMNKMHPTQVKNAEVVLTPSLVKNLQLEVLANIMEKEGISQINLESAEKVGSLYIATINDVEGNLLEEDVVVDELKKAMRTYNYENLRMQKEVPDAVYDEHITLGRQISKKIIENIPDNHEYTINGQIYTGSELKEHYFNLFTSNIYQDAIKTLIPFDVRVDGYGNIVGDVSYDTIVNILEKEGIDRNLTKNIIYSVQQGNNGLSRLPIFFNTFSQKWENILTSRFTNGINNQKFPGLDASQMSGLFMNRKKGVKQSELTSTEGINYHNKIFTKINPDGKEIKTNDIRLRSSILFDGEESRIIKAQVLLPRWAKEFYETDENGIKKGIDINNLSDDVRTMVGYRVPTEAKYSMYIFEVVGFLPDDNGPSIVLPDNFTTQTGSDFDMDTVYALLANLKRTTTTFTDDTGKQTKVTTVERIIYNDLNTEAGLNARVDAIMRDKNQLVHILALATDNKSLTIGINSLNTLMDEYATSNEFLIKHKPHILERINQLNKIIATSKGRIKREAILEKNDIYAETYTDETFLFYKDRPEYKNLTNIVKDIVSQLSILDQNTRKARENRILDLYESILTNPLHYTETIATSNFREITNVGDIVNDLLNLGKHRISPLTFDGQQEFRDKAHQGRNLKSISIALDRFNSIAQVAGITLADRLVDDENTVRPIDTLPVIEYVVNEEQKSYLQKAFKGFVTFETRNGVTYAKVIHKFIGNNPSNTFTNVKGDKINQYSAQTTANILDNVNFPLPNNINEYTVNVWKMLVSIGSTFEISTLFVNQPILRDLAFVYFKNRNSISEGRQIEIVKRAYQTLLYKAINKRTGVKNEYFDKAIANGDSIRIVGSDQNQIRQYNLLGYKNNEGIVINSGDLTKNINLVTIHRDKNDNFSLNEIETATPERLLEIENTLRYQLQIIETFKHYNKYAEAIKDGSAVLSTDKIGAGPTFDTSNSLLYNINRVHKLGILQIDDVSAMIKIFPKYFGRDEISRYPILEQFLILSNLVSLKMFNKHFTGQSNLYSYIKSVINLLATDRSFDRELARSVTQYLNNSLLKDLPWLNDISIEERRNILGVNRDVNLTLDLKSDEDLIAFERLSLANQIFLLKIAKDYPAGHILNHLEIHLQEKERKKNGYHVIRYINNDNPDGASLSINELWGSDNIFERIVARNLVKYEYLVNGFNFGFSKLGKVIPNNIFYYGTETFMDGNYTESGIGLSAHLYKKLHEINTTSIDEENPFDEVANAIFNSDPITRFLRSNWMDDRLVPDAGNLRRWEPTAVNEEGEQGQWIRYFQVKNGIISLHAKDYTNIPTSKLWNNVKSKDIVKLSIANSTTKETDYILFQRVNSFANVDEDGNITGTIYYYPIGKLNYNENEDKSIFPKNNQLHDGTEIQDAQFYLNEIAQLNKKDSVMDKIYPRELPMNFTTQYGAFREELSEYTNTLDLIRAGKRTATTRKADTGEAQKWEGIKLGQYIQLKGTDEFVKVTKTLHHIDLSNSRFAREEWSQKEGWDRSILNQVEDGIVYQDRNDLFQFEYKYIGTLEDVMKDSDTIVSEKENPIIDQSDNSTIREFTPENIQSLNENEVFVFGSNTEGRHGKGAAKVALDKFGAIYGQAEGLQGQSYAIITKDLSKGERSYPLYKVSMQISRLIGFAQEHKDIKFYVTKIGSSLAGYSINEIKEQFKKNYDSIGIPDNIILPKEYEVRDENNDVKSVSYTSSTNQSVNNAISSADEFIKKTYANYLNRTKVLKNYGALKDTVSKLTDLGVQREIGELDLANLADALKTVLAQMDLDLNAPKTDDKKGGILAQLDMYENMDLDTIITDPLVRKEFINFMSRTLSFLKGITTFDTLNSVNGNEFIEEEKIINNLIKELQNLIPAIKNAQNKFNNLYNNFVEANLAEYTSNPEIIAGIKKILDPADDESYIQLQLDALADTNNPFVALMVKQYMVNMTNADMDSTKEIGELEALLRKTFGKNITSLTDLDFDKYLEHKNGKRTGKLVQKYDWDRFYADRKAYFNHIIKTYGKGSEEYKRRSKLWYKNNEIKVVTNEEIELVRRKKEEELSKSEYEAWERRNYTVIDGQIMTKVSDSGFSTPTDKYLNPEWTKIKEDPLYQKFVEILSKYTDHFGKYTILNRGIIPTLANKEGEHLSITEKISKWIESNKAQKQSESFVGENDEMVYLLTVPMIEYFSQENEIEISNRKKNELPADHELRVIEEVEKAGRGKFNSLGAIHAENKRIRQANDEYHAGKISYNLYDVFTKFIREANRYKAKASMKHEYDMGLYQLRNMKFNKRDSQGKLLKNNAATKGFEKTVTGIKTGEGTNIQKHFAEWLEAIFYGNFDIDEGDWTKVSKILMKFTSAKNMWFNMTAGVNNVAIGKIQIRLEAFAGWYFKHEDLNKADLMYMAAIPDMIKNLGSTKANNLTTAIIKLMDVAQNTNERDFTTGMLKQQLMSWSSLYFINDLGEHYMQNASALAMMNHHRIIDGKIMSLAEYQFSNYKEALLKIIDEEETKKLDIYLKVRYENEEFKEGKHDYLRDYILTLPIKKQGAFIEAKKALDATTNKDFEAYPKLIDAFYLDENGYAKMRDEIEIAGKKYNTSLSKNQFALFRNKAIKVVQKQQGIYNKEDASIIQRRALGKLVIQFKKYMRPGWNKRFGSKFGKSFWTESRDEYDKGAYVSLWQFIRSPKARHTLDLNEQKEYQAMFGRFLSDTYHFATNVRLYWNTLDDFEKGNVRRALMDQVYLCACIAVGAILKNLKPDDDDDHLGYDLAVYEVDRLLSETMMFSPIGIVNEGQKILTRPTAVQGTLIDTYKFLRDAVEYPFQDDANRVYKTGIYAKELKIKVDALKLVPIVNKIQQIERINKFNKYYILFRG